MPVAEYPKEMTAQILNKPRKELEDQAISNRFKRALGRPTKLNKQTITKIVQFYVDYPLYYEVPTEKQDKQGNVETTMKMIPNKPPTLTQLADSIGVTRFTVYNWNTRYPKFFNLIKKHSDNITKDMIKSFALTGDYNATFSIFTMKNKFGWTDRIDVNDGKASTNSAVNIQINNYLSKPAKTGDKQLLPQSETPGELPAFKID